MNNFEKIMIFFYKDKLTENLKNTFPNNINKKCKTLHKKYNNTPTNNWKKIIINNNKKTYQILDKLV